MTLVELQARALAILKADFDAFAREAARIRLVGRHAGWVPLELTDEQKRIHDVIMTDLGNGRGSRIIVLKARKLGVSTYVQALAYWLGAFNDGWESLTVAHQASSTRKIASIGTGIASRLPSHLAPFIGARKVEGGLAWANGSKLEVMTQRSDHAARGSSPSLLHMSEVGFWDVGRAASSAEDAIIATLSAIESDGAEPMPGTIAIIESTANGQSGAMYDRWRSAQKGASGWTPLFFPWHTAKKHSAAVLGYRSGDRDLMMLAEGSADPESTWRTSHVFASADGSRDHEAGEVWAPRAVQFNLSPEQVRFGVAKWRGDMASDLAKFDQEFPLSAALAFAASGRPVLPESIRATILEPIEPAPAVFGMLPTIEPGKVPTWEKSTAAARAGHAWRIYSPPVPGWTDRYTIGVDVAGGLGGDADASCIQVFDRIEKRQVAQLYSNTIQPDELGDQADAIGRLYGGTQGSAYLVVEANNHGLTTIRRLLDLGYPRLYTRDSKMQPGTVLQWANVYGFNTNGATRPDILNGWRKALVTEGWAMYSPELSDEARSFVYGDEERMDHLPGEHSDAIMASAMALVGHRLLGEPTALRMVTHDSNRALDPVDYDAQETPSWLLRFH